MLGILVVANFKFIEVESGGKTDAERPQLSLALEICRKQNAVLICSKIDRLSRNAEFLLRLMNSKVEFICCDIPNCDRFTISLFAILAEKEKNMISLVRIGSMAINMNRQDQETLEDRKVIKEILERMIFRIFSAQCLADRVGKPM
jgi:DNA invertase Pin-like site-specific DNA recombinase